MAKKEQTTAYEKVEQQRKFFLWVQEFSKKIVVLTFILYIGIVLFSAFTIYFTAMVTGTPLGIDTLLTEMNLTFREVIGGYIIKAAVENAIKIGGSYYNTIAEDKLDILRQDIALKQEEMEMSCTVPTSEVESDVLPVGDEDFVEGGVG